MTNRIKNVRHSPAGQRESSRYGWLYQSPPATRLS